MASVEHCLYCFEALAAHLEGREPMTLREVEMAWEEFSAAPDTATGSQLDGLKKQQPLPLPAGVSSLASTPSGGSSASTLSLEADTPATSTSSLAPPPASTSTKTKTAVSGEFPLFVTWNKVAARSGNTMLRGCIGTFEAQELDEGLSSYAVTSAMHDSRFDPVSQRELASLEVAVTLLTDFEDCEGAMDWDLGVHGIRISFVDRGRRYGATYLPDVAVEQGWSKEETLVSLMRKAGWVGRRDRWDDVNLAVVRYQGKKRALAYPEFKLWRDWCVKTRGA